MRDTGGCGYRVKRANLWKFFAGVTDDLLEYHGRHGELPAGINGCLDREHGDFGRRYVLDPIMLTRALTRLPKSALDVGCGEGRFCRMLKPHGVDVTGIDPTAALVAAARQRDAGGAYLEAAAECLPFEDEVSTYDNYLQERSMWIDYRGIRIMNHHRPVSTSMLALLDAGLRLTYFDEPAPSADAPASQATNYC